MPVAAVTRREPNLPLYFSFSFSSLILFLNPSCSDKVSPKQQRTKRKGFAYPRRTFPTFLFPLNKGYALRKVRDGCDISPTPFPCQHHVLSNDCGRVSNDVFEYLLLSSNSVTSRGRGRGVKLRISRTCYNSVQLYCKRLPHRIIPFTNTCIKGK